MYENFIAERIEQLLKTKGVSAYKASYDLGQSKTYIGKITKEKIMPSMKMFLAICEYFNVTPVEFFDPSLNKETMAYLNEFFRLSKEDRCSVIKITKAFEHYNK